MRNNTLNEIDGNTILIPIPDIDTYHCKECDKDVPEDEFNHRMMMCYSCWFKT